MKKVSSTSLSHYLEPYSDVIVSFAVLVEEELLANSDALSRLVHPDIPGYSIYLPLLSEMTPST